MCCFLYTTMQVFTDEFIKLLSPELQQRARSATAIDALQMLDCLKPQQRSSALRGIEGEGEVFDQLEKGLQNYKVELVSSTARSGDITITGNNGLRMMVDVKNYTSNVPTKEADKFIRDVEHRNYDTAILLSLNTRVTGYKAIQFDVLRTPQRTVHFAILQSNSPAVLLEIVQLLFQMCELRMTTLGDQREWMLERFSDLEQVMRKIGEARQNLSTSVQALHNILQGATESMIHVELDACRIIGELRSGIRAETYTRAKIDELDLKPTTHIVVQKAKQWKLSADRKKIQCQYGSHTMRIGLMKTTSDTIEITDVDTAAAYLNVPHCQKWNYAPQSKTLSTVIDSVTLDTLLNILTLDDGAESDSG